jgi:hypothetical protein
MPSLVPSGPSQDVFLVLARFGERLGRAWRETDEDDTDYETLIRHLLEGQCNNPVRVVAFNTDEGWSRDVSDELRERCAQRGEVPDFLLDFLEAHDTGRPLQTAASDRDLTPTQKNFSIGPATIGT